MTKQEIDNIRIDKSKWTRGEWDDEPDRVDFESHGFACMLLRVPSSGHWCGYVGVPMTHRMAGVHYDDVAIGPNNEYPRVHGGLTYSDKCSGRICHIPKPGMPDDVWWFGFDCAHAGDLCPASAYVMPGDIYRNVEYVRSQTESLAEQLAQ